jgi:hypothetical protein
VLSGATTSSLGIRVLRQDPQSPLGTMWGTPRDIRSDEFLTGTAAELNVLSLGHTSSAPLAESPDLVLQVASGQPFETLFFYDGNLLRLGPWLPDAMLFAASRALPFLVLALTLPPLLQRLGASRPLSWLGYALVVLAPASLWWSFTPPRVLSYASLGCFLLVVATERWAAATAVRSRAAALVLAALGGIALARLGGYYVPWSLTIGVPLVLAVAAWILFGPQRRAGLLVLGVGAACGGALLALVFWENAEAVRATLDTLYPGQRRATGDLLAPFHLLGAPGFHHLTGGERPAIGNQSENSSAFLVCALWALLLVLRPSDATRAQRAAFAALGVSIAVWVAWCTTAWGSFGAALPLLNLVTPPRAAQTVGFAATLLLVIVLGRTRKVGPWSALVVALACGLATAYGVTSLRGTLLTMSLTEVWVSSLAVVVAIWVVTVFPNSWLAIVPLCGVLLWSGAQVNPVILGLGDLRDRQAAGAVRQIGADARSDASYVASDDPLVSALLVANGVPSMTGWQIAGPREDLWVELDPDRSEELVWNRGASYLRMSFDGAAGAEPVLSNPTPDTVLISVDPCSIPEVLKVETLITHTKLDAPCLTQSSEFVWVGKRQRVYTVGSSG